MKFYVYRDVRGEYRWYLRAANGNKLADSGEGYRTKKDCLSGMALVMQTTLQTPWVDQTGEA